MHPKSQTTFLTGQLNSSPAGNSTFYEMETPLYALGTPLPKTAASQLQSGTSISLEGMQSAGSPDTQGLGAKPISQVPISVALPKPRPIISGGPIFQTRQLWEGTITEVRNHGFVAVLIDKTNPNNPDEQVLFDDAEVSDEDQQFIKAGSSFYWIIGAERTRAGQLKNVSTVQFRRLPTWTRSALLEGEKRARRVREVFRSEK
jgi:hypothetical protein